jgi:hypothetical protein
MMYDYTEKSEPLCILNAPSNLEIFVDEVPTNHPYLPRLCNKQGQVFLWTEDNLTVPQLYADSQKCKNESQWVISKNNERIEMAVSLVHVYEDVIIIGCVKTAGYVQSLGKQYVKSYIKNVWSDILNIFPNKTIVCPAGSYIEYIHLVMNQKRIPRTPYHKKIMKSFGFVREDNYWIRHGLNN